MLCSPLLRSVAIGRQPFSVAGTTGRTRQWSSFERHTWTRRFASSTWP